MKLLIKPARNLMGYISRSLNHFISSKSRFLTSPIVALSGLFILCFVSRYWLSRFMFGPRFFLDENLDSCILPFQLSQGETLWGGNTHYLAFFIRLAAYHFFGFGTEVARATNIFVFASSVVVFYQALDRPFGKKVSWYVVALMLVSSPFIVHSILATSLTFSLLPTALILWILSRPITKITAGLLGPLLVAGLYLYPAAFLTGVCLIFFHTTIFHRGWTWKTRSIFFTEFVFFAALAFRIHFLVTENPSWKQWGGGFLSFGQVGQNIMVVLKDLFWESLSWLALNSDAPYLDTVTVGFLMVGVASSFVFSTLHPSTFERKWIWTCLLAFLGSMVLSALAHPYPGVRRVFSSLPLLFLIAGLGLKRLWQWEAFRPFLVGTILVCFAVVALRSYVISQKDWPALRYWTREPDFIVGARGVLLQNMNGQTNVVIIGYPSDPWEGADYRCALSLDGSVNPHFRSVIVIPRSSLGKRQDAQGEFILLANELFSQKELQDTFGYPPTSSKIREFSKSPELDKLLAIYEFKIGPMN